MNPSIKNIDNYMALQPEKAMIALEEIRQTVHNTVPDAVEVISYGMPAFKYRGRILIYFAGFKNHCSLFPGSKAVIAKFKKELKGYKTSPGTISFKTEKPLPTTLVKKILKEKVKEIKTKI